MPGDYSNNLSIATLAIHADDPINQVTDVAPPLHVSTTFRYPTDPDKLVRGRDFDPTAQHPPGGPAPGDSHIYSRLTAPNTSRLEVMLTSIIGAPCLTYSSGLSAFHAILVYLNPKVVAIGEGYHGCHGVLEIYQKLTKCKIVDLFDEKSWDGEGFSLGKGDVVHLETPLNPTGKAFNVEKSAALAHARGAYLTIDATFAPPPLLDPFMWGADFVMHSGTKYFGGHSDMLCGIVGISTKTEGWEKHYWKMYEERLFLGAVMGSLEGWLGVRSLRTFELRVKRQSENATKLVAFISGAIEGTEKGEDAEAVKKVIAKIEHASLQKEDIKEGWLQRQMPNGYGPVFSIWAHSEKLAKRLPSKLHFFHHATSLGGVESLIEWRSMSDSGVEGTLLRVSIGVEDWNELKVDIVRGCTDLATEGSTS